jgi:ribosomal protein S18 acetylase RimI-like enzyme
MAAPVPRLCPLTRPCRRQLERWQRQRQFVVLLAEDIATGQLLGTATLSLTRCEAALPPPFPTSKLLRCSHLWALELSRHSGPQTLASFAGNSGWKPAQQANHPLQKGRVCIAHKAVRGAALYIDLDAVCMPCRLYVSNMVTAPDARRQGVATQLLQACMRIGEVMLLARLPSCRIHAVA